MSSPQPPVLHVSIELSENEPRLLLRFSARKYAKSRGGAEHALGLGPAKELDGIRCDQAGLFGIRFSTANRAQDWRKSHEKAWGNVFVLHDTSRTVWVRRSLPEADLDKLLPPQPSESSERQDEGPAVGMKSHVAPGRLLADKFSKATKKVF